MRVFAAFAVCQLSVAELLDPLDRQTIEADFGQTLHQVYPCTEGFLAATCSHGDLHINEDVVYVQKEYVDRESGKSIPIITDFSRITQPIIRYRLNDLLTERKEPCPCGSPFMAIEHIGGRCEDIFAFPALSEERLIPIFPDFITRVIITSSSEVTAYHAILLAPNLLELALEVSDKHREAAQAAILQSLQALCERTGSQQPVA